MYDCVDRRGHLRGTSETPRTGRSQSPSQSTQCNDPPQLRSAHAVSFHLRPALGEKHRWVNHAMPFAILLAFLAVFAVALRWNPVRSVYWRTCRGCVSRSTKTGCPSRIGGRRFTARCPPLLPLPLGPATVSPMSDIFTNLPNDVREVVRRAAVDHPGSRHHHLRRPGPEIRPTQLCRASRSRHRRRRPVRRPGHRCRTNR